MLSGSWAIQAAMSSHGGQTIAFADAPTGEAESRCLVKAAAGF